MKLPRWIHRLYASTFGYFWLPCPLCRKMFGGHEWNQTLWNSWSSGEGVCSNCEDEVKARNRKFFTDNPAPDVWPEKLIDAIENTDFDFDEVKKATTIFPGETDA